MERNKINPITALLCISAGAHLSILKKCPTQILKYSTMGVILWITAIMASLSGGFFFNSVFKIQLSAIIFGIFWGAAIFSLDRYIVTNLNIKKGALKSNLGVYTRIFLAICLGIVVAKPLELKIFEKEIASQISIDNSSKINRQLNSDSTLLMVNNRIKSLKVEEEKLDSVLRKRKTIVYQLNEDYINEVKGNGIGLATNAEGYGPEANRKLEIYETERERIFDYEKKVNARKDEIKKAIASLEKDRTDIENRISVPIVNSDGPLEQLNALHNLIKDEWHLRLANLFITLIFMFFELAPVFVKLSMKAGLYEELKEEQESLDKSIQFEELHLKKYKIEMNMKRKKSQYNGEVSQDEQIKNKVREKEFEIALDVVDKFFQNQNKKLDNDDFTHKLFDRIKKRLSNFQSNGKESHSKKDQYNYSYF